MGRGFFAVTAIVAGGCSFSATCNDNEDTTTPPGTTAGTTSGTTSTGCPDPVDPECLQVCGDFWGCYHEVFAQCPCMLPESETDWMCGTTESAGCFANCDANPAMKAVIDPNDCCLTIATLVTLNPYMPECCGEDWVDPCGGSGAGGTGGAGGAGGSAGSGGS